MQLRAGLSELGASCPFPGVLGSRVSFPDPTREDSLFVEAIVQSQVTNPPYRFLIRHEKVGP